MVKSLLFRTDPDPAVSRTQVVRLVGEHMSGKVTLSPLHLTQPNLPLEEISAVLRQRQAAMKMKPTDSNAATHLIRRFCPPSTPCS